MSGLIMMSNYTAHKIKPILKTFSLFSIGNEHTSNHSHLYTRARITMSFCDEHYQYNMRFLSKIIEIITCFILEFLSREMYKFEKNMSKYRHRYILNINCDGEYIQ